MTRRDLLRSAAVVPVASSHVVASGHITPPSTRLERLVELGKSNVGRFFEFEGWNVQFTGWKASVGHLDRAHQWVARPIIPVSIFAKEIGMAFVVSMPGFCGVIRTGESIDISLRSYAQVGYGLHSLLYGEGIFDRGVEVTAQVVLEAITGAASFELLDRTREWGPIVVTWDYAKTTDQTRFYLDPLFWASAKFGQLSDSDRHSLLQAKFKEVYRIP